MGLRGPSLKLSRGFHGLLGVISGPFCAFSGLFEGLLGSLGVCRPFPDEDFGGLGDILGLLGGSWVTWRSLWAVMGPSWAAVGVVWGPF